MSIPYTGERFIPGHGGAPIHFEHLHRYYLAGRIATGRVLDLGSGAGYGSKLLSRTARHVVALDISPEAVDFAAKTFAAPNIHYATGDARAIPLGDRTMNFAVCVEMIEHLQECEVVVAELARVLADDGQLLISTPNRPVYRDDPEHSNPFHVREFDEAEFRALLSQHFDDIVFIGQRLVAGSLTWNFEEGSGDDSLQKFRLSDEFAPGLAMDEHPKYILALCARKKGVLRRNVLNGSIAVGSLEAFIEDLTRSLLESDSRIRQIGREFEDAVAAWRRHSDGLVQELDRTKADLARIHGSKMWRAWAAYHAVRDFLSHPMRPARRVAGAVLRRLRAPQSILFAATVPFGWLYVPAWSARTWLKAMGKRASLLPPPAPAALKRRPRILMVCPYGIYPPNHGGGVRIFNLLRRLSRHCDFHILIFNRAGDDPEQRRALMPYARSVHFHKWNPSVRRDLWGLEPHGSRLFSVPEVQRQINGILSREGIDILQLEYAEMGQYGLPQYARVKVVLIEHDIAFRSRARRRRLGLNRRYLGIRELRETRMDVMRSFRSELRAAERADQIQVMSEEDGNYLARFLPSGASKIRVVGNGVDIEQLTVPPRAERSRRQLLFLGNFQHLPNRDALDYLMSEVWPAIRQRVADAELVVVGAHAGPEVRRYHGRDGVTVAGEVADVRPYHQHCAAFIAPIRAGSGTRLKILEAFACGTPVVTTTIGAEGIDGVPGEHFLVGDTPAELAEQACAVLLDDALAARLGAAGRELAERVYSWDRSAGAALAGYAELLEDLHGQPEIVDAEKADPVEVSIVIPTLNGGAMLEQSLAAIRRQQIRRPYEVICVDSGSPASDLTMMETYGARVIRINKADFNHGLTRDLGASHAKGRVLVFINQDVVPVDEEWLEHITAPLFENNGCAAVQGAITEVPEPEKRFYWDSNGPRFYFTRESRRWMERYFGIGFSTVNAALRRDVWERFPFGYAPIMEDKKWQRAVVEAGYGIGVELRACVYHTHNYGMRSLLRRCQSEGFGWRTIGEKYSLYDMLADLMQPRVYADLLLGLVKGRIRSSAELFFPVLRPLMVYRGNRWNRDVKL